MAQSNWGTGKAPQESGSSGNWVERIKEERAAGDPRHVRKAGAVYLLVDCSSSMRGAALREAQKGAKDFCQEALAQNKAVGLVSFHSEPELVIRPTGKLNALTRQIDDLWARGRTDLAGALTLAMSQVEEKTAPPVFVIVTDGLPDDPDRALAMASRAKHKGIRIIAIGTANADSDFLRKLASGGLAGDKVSLEQLAGKIRDSARLLGNPENR